jgi:hypothetical protein
VGAIVSNTPALHPHAAAAVEVEGCGEHHLRRGGVYFGLEGLRVKTDVLPCPNLCQAQPLARQVQRVENQMRIKSELLRCLLISSATAGSDLGCPKLPPQDHQDSSFLTRPPGSKKPPSSSKYYPNGMLDIP